MVNKLIVGIPKIYKGKVLLKMESFTMVGFINVRRKKILRKRILKTLQEHKPRKILDNGAGEEDSWNYERTSGKNSNKFQLVTYSSSGIFLCITPSLSKKTALFIILL